MKIETFAQITKALDSADLNIKRAAEIQQQAVDRIEELNSDLLKAVNAGQDLQNIIQRADAGEPYGPQVRQQLIESASKKLNTLVNKYCFGGEKF